MDFSLWIGLGVLQVILVLGLISAFYLVHRNSRQEGLIRFQDELKRLELRVEQLEVRGNNNTEIFKTVLHGFDFIVQGCKKAILIDEAPTDIPISLNEEPAAYLDQGKNKTSELESEKVVN